jgi:hypothetical protein
MRKIIILLSMSLCTLAEAQKAFEWQVKLGLYSDIYGLPEIRDVYQWQFRGKTYAYATASIGLEIIKWRILLQLNADSKLTFWNSNFNWKIDDAVINAREANIPPPLPEVGDYVRASYSYFNILNALYRIRGDDGISKIYVGFGVCGRYESVSYISYIDQPGTYWPVLIDGSYGYRLAPNIKMEYQYNLSKRYFLSTHLNYAWFDKTPHSYWQFALNGGIRF